MSARSAMSARDRRALVGGVLVLGAIGAGARGLPTLRAWRADRIAAATELLAAEATARALLRADSALRIEVGAQRRAIDSARARLVPGETPAAASGALVGILSAAAKAADVRLGSMQVAADTSRGGLARVSVRAEAIGDIGGLTRLLLRLERGPTLVRVRELAVSQTEPAAPATQMEALRVELHIEGLAAARSAARPTPPAAPVAGVRR